MSGKFGVSYRAWIDVFINRLRVKFFLILFFLPLQNFAQDITGTWAGFLLVNDTKVPYELVISGHKNNLSGYSMLTFTFDGVENVGVKTTEIKIKRASIAIEDGELIFDNYSNSLQESKIVWQPGLGRQGFQYDIGRNIGNKIYRYEGS